MTDDETERLIRETFARCVPDDDLRREIVARVRTRELLQDPDVLAACNLLSGALPDELDPALRMAVERRVDATHPEPADRGGEPTGS